MAKKPTSFRLEDKTLNRLKALQILLNGLYPGKLSQAEVIDYALENLEKELLASKEKPMRSDFLDEDHVFEDDGFDFLKRD